MKKFLVVILSLISVLAMSLSLTACSCLSSCNGFKGKDGINGTNGEDGKDGKDGIGIKNVEINSDGELIIIYSDDTSKNVGKVAGADGMNGKDGLGIKDVKFDADGSMAVIFTDDTSKNLGKIPYCKHDFDVWQTVLEATCTSIGYSTHECKICGYVEYNFTEAKGHKWDDGEEFSGKILKTCTVCNATKIEEKPTIAEPPVEEEHKFITPVENAEISYGYVYSINQSGQMAIHTGVDFACEAGVSVKAVLDGTIAEIVADDVLYGGYIVIRHKGEMTTIYKYVASTADLKVGDNVNRGDIIGTVVEACGVELKQGEHIHFETTVKGEYVDPAKYFDITT